jgi:hypothetical protein
VTAFGEVGHGQVGGHVERPERGVRSTVLRHVRHTATHARPGRARREVAPVERDRTRDASLGAEEQSQERAAPGTDGPGHAEDLAGPHGEVHVAHCAATQPGHLEPRRID